MTFRHKRSREGAGSDAKTALPYVRYTAGGEPVLLDRNGDPIRAFIATPAYDGRVLTDFAISIAETCLVLGRLRVHVTASIMGNGAFIDIARNAFVRMFLDSDCTHLFYIDADLKWEARAVVGLLGADLPISAGVYPKRQDPEEYPATFAKDPDTDGVWVTARGDEGERADDGWIQCERVPTGFLCIRRDVVEQMAEQSPVQAMKGHAQQPVLFNALSFARRDGRHESVDLIHGDFTPEDFLDFLGEDFYFCDRYRRQFGRTIPAWPDFDFTHGARWRGNWHEFLVKQGQEESADA